jgi:hypothetical protein
MVNLLVQITVGVITYALSYLALNRKITAELKSFITQ